MKNTNNLYLGIIFVLVAVILVLVVVLQQKQTSQLHIQQDILSDQSVNNNNAKEEKSEKDSYDLNVSSDVYEGREAYITNISNEHGFDVLEVDILTIDTYTDPEYGIPSYDIANVNDKVRRYVITENTIIQDARQGAIQSGDISDLQEVLSYQTNYPQDVFTWIQLWTNSDGAITKVLIPYQV